mmetsp:Transcript_27091/g.54826  ORF Transcript_27091/g.54826 Transcript_27091/m.54826 type:complete len:206 (+) Transcript_27091:396-1013(+)
MVMPSGRSITSRPSAAHFNGASVRSVMEANGYAIRTASRRRLDPPGHASCILSVAMVSTASKRPSTKTFLSIAKSTPSTRTHGSTTRKLLHLVTWPTMSQELDRGLYHGSYETLGTPTERSTSSRSIAKAASSIPTRTGSPRGSSSARSSSRCTGPAAGAAAPRRSTPSSGSSSAWATSSSTRSRTPWPTTFRKAASSWSLPFCD